MKHSECPSALRESVAAALGYGGGLASADLGFRPREGQLRMASAVSDALEQESSLVVEAGTGIGKTFAYLVPVLLSGCRVLISTATKSLQDQLFLRDLPRLAGALKVPVRAALLKGRASYLCLHRMEQARKAELLPDRWSLRALARIETWSQATSTGDLSEVEGLDDQSSLIPLITSSRDNCLGSECPRFGECHVIKARRDAMAADVVVINHHLFFADVALRDSGVAEILPSVDAVVFDEAHQLTDTGLHFLGTTLSTAQVTDLARDLIRLGMSKARGLREWADLGHSLEESARKLRLVCSEGTSGAAMNSKLRWSQCVSQPTFLPSIHGLAVAASSAVKALVSLESADPDLGQVATRLKQIEDLSLAFAQPMAADRIRWVDLTAHSMRFVESPLDIRSVMTHQRQAARKAWIFTSATLGDDDELAWFCAGTGLEDAVKMRVGSPFDFATQARLWVVKDMPRPNDPRHSSSVGELAARCAGLLGGRTFVLTTTLKAISVITATIEEIAKETGIRLKVLAQGSQPKRTLLADYGDGEGKILVGSHSFWEGIDVRGTALQCVVIDKLPFPPPNDPLIEARGQALEGQGGDPFNDLFVPEATILLKQGSGRLIRSETDRGLLVICDPRMATMPYGRRMRAGLPPMTVINDFEEAGSWLRQLAQDGRFA